MTHTINGKQLTECTLDELKAEWEGGMYLDTCVGLTKEQDERLTAVECEMHRRETAVHQ